MTLDFDDCKFSGHALTEPFRVTATLRAQAKTAVRAFLQEVLDDPRNADFFTKYPDKQVLARDLYRDALVIVYRLLFILKLEASSHFSLTSFWQNTYSPSMALAPLVRKTLDEGLETGDVIGDRLRGLCRMFRDGYTCGDVKIGALGGMLFGENAAPILDAETLQWSERAAARLLDALLWTPKVSKKKRQSVDYGPMDVEDLGRVFEALLELEPGLATEPMCRLRRQKLDFVVPITQGKPYRQHGACIQDEPDDDEFAIENQQRAHGKKRVFWIEDIREGAFYLRAGHGRKTSGSYYTPRAFVRFLIQETLGPQIAAVSPENDPKPLEILALKVLDPAMGSGHFLVEACRYLGDALYKAVWFCDKQAKDAEEAAEKAFGAERDKHLHAGFSWRQRIADLPDLHDELLAHLPSRTSIGEKDGDSQAKAKALCRQLVVLHCLYGVDKHPLAVELAKLALWLESSAEGLPLTFLDDRLLEGDSLTGPMFADLGRRLKDKPSRRLGGSSSRAMHSRLAQALGNALVYMRDVAAMRGKDAGNFGKNSLAKQNLDRALAPFLTLAAAWSGGRMLGDEADEDAYAELMELVATNGDVAAFVAGERAETLRKMIALGKSGISYDLRFPEVFYPNGNVEERAGFGAVVGNPPWDSVRRSDDQFFFSIDFRVLEFATRAEKSALIKELMARPDVRRRYDEYVEQLEAKDRVIDALFHVHKARIKGALAGRGMYDDYLLFGERSALVTRPGTGMLGLVLPSAFHANEGAVGLRRLYIEQMALKICYSFENRRKLFEIDSRFKFALLVVANHEPSPTTHCAFYVHDPEWLFDDARSSLVYHRDFIVKTGGDYLCLLELRTPRDLEVGEQCFAATESLGETRSRYGIAMGQELNMTYDAHRFAPFTNSSQRALLTLHEGKTFHQFTDRWDTEPRYGVASSALFDKPNWVEAARYFRLAFRDIASSTNERTGIFAMLPPGVICGNKAPCERDPAARPTWTSLVLLAVANSFAFDFVLRLKVQATVNLFILDGCPIPPAVFARPRAVFLGHAALRLSCNHEAYAALWKDQLGDETWRESKRKHAWPVLEGDDVRWDVRAAIDAVVAEAYGLSRAHYEHVLGSFSHKSYPKAREKCLAEFDELKRVGLEAFVKKHDPYHDIPFNENLPRPSNDDHCNVTLNGKDEQIPTRRRAAEQGDP